MELSNLKANHTIASEIYRPVFRRLQLLDAADRGKLWRSIAIKFPSYQILPETNHVSYIKNNLLASLYSIGRSAEILPTSDQDKNLSVNVNLMIDYMWDLCEVPYYQMLAGERAALTNLGITQVGWDALDVRGTGDYLSNGMPRIKQIDPMKFMRDPFAETIDTAKYAITWDEYHKDFIKHHPLWGTKFNEYLETRKSGNVTAEEIRRTLDKDQTRAGSSDYYTVYVHYVIENGNLSEYHTINNEFMLYEKTDMKPGILPFAELYCNVPAGDIIGTSEPSKILANSVVYNVMNSIMLTAEYKNQRPPRFVNQSSGIDLRSFIKQGAEADTTFIVQNDASRAVHYHQFPQVSPMVAGIMSNLGNDIKEVTGVDAKYTGGDTGSILTTGGIEAMLDQATMIDQPKLVNYERYTRRLTQLMVSYLITHGGKRAYYIKNKTNTGYAKIEVDFTEIPDDILLNYAINISAHLPKNKMRNAQMATMLMEKQMQYASSGQQVSLITPEEWLALQDLPFKEMMLERMKLERNRDFVEQVSQTVFQYASLVDQGMNPEDAMLATADALSNRYQESQPL